MLFRSPSLDPGNESGFVDMCNLSVCDSRRNVSSDQQLIDLLESKSLESKLVLGPNHSDEEDDEDENEEESLELAAGRREGLAVSPLSEPTPRMAGEQSLAGFLTEEAKKGRAEARSQPPGPQGTVGTHRRGPEAKGRGPGM